MGKKKKKKKKGKGIVLRRANARVYRMELLPKLREQPGRERQDGRRIRKGGMSVVVYNRYPFTTPGFPFPFPFPFAVSPYSHGVKIA